MSTTPSPEYPQLPALDKCCAAYQQAFAEELEKGSERDQAELKAGEAYRASMPFLVDLSAIRAFIACVSHGMLLGVFTGDLAAGLLHAAQVALGSHRNPQRPRPAGRPKRSC